MTGQLPLPIPCRTRCGYCLRALVLQPAGDWACPRCAPILRNLGRGLPYGRVIDLFRDFQHDAWKDRVR